MSDTVLRFVSLRRVVLVVLFACVLPLVSRPGADAQTLPARSTPLHTSWGETLNPDSVHAEYPRPTLVRSEWLNLNGYWDWKNVNDPNEGFYQRILVPFPVESALSGVMQHTERCIYRRTFTIPPDWKEDDHLLLHFGAVDWEASVFVNGEHVGTHRGGYDSFSFDITPFVHRAGSNELVVQVFDPSQNGEQPRGKQSSVPAGIWYTASTGIWQTVWLEPVPPHYIRTLQIHADPRTGLVTILPILNAPHKELRVFAEAFDGNESIGKSYGGSDGPLLMPFDRGSIKAWSPDSPHLYHIRVQVLYRDIPLDTVSSYFAFRHVEVTKDRNGFPVIHLNGNRLFLMGVVDQGFWPDGLYTAPSDGARLADILTAKRLGFNVIRKYQKIEPERWYFWCDHFGILVWQDMPSGENRSPESQQQFRTELQRMIQSRLTHPSIIAWTIFNEGAGQHQTPEYVELLRRIDPTRLINGASGWTDFGLGDVHASHRFPGPVMPRAEANRAAVIGLFGGLTLVPPAEHRWTEDTWAYQHVPNSAAFIRRYEQMHDELRQMIQTRGLAGAFFHQLTDIESECNGLVPYDRRNLKVPEKMIEQINQGTIKLGSD